MSFIWHDVEQGSEKWFNLRLGIPTASEATNILTAVKGERSKAQRSYMARLIGESLATHLPAGAPSYTSRAMDWGRQCEGEARRFYTMETGNIVVNGGFCTTDDGRLGASPDGLIGLEMLERGWKCTGALELKCPQPETQAEYVLDAMEAVAEGRRPTVPTDYRWQCHQHIIVCDGAEWCDFLSYVPSDAKNLQHLLIRQYPNDDTDKLRTELDRFHGNYMAALSKLRAA